MINNLFTDERFMPVHMRKYGILGAINRNLQQFLSAFYEWKKAEDRMGTGQPQLVDFYQVKPLRDSETLFYEVGLSPEEAEALLDAHILRLKEFARYILAHVHAVVLEEPRALHNAPFLAGLKLRDTVFDPERMRAAWLPHAASTEIHQWNLDPLALEPFLARRPAAQEVTR